MKVTQLEEEEEDVPDPEPPKKLFFFLSRENQNNPNPTSSEGKDPLKNSNSAPKSITIGRLTYVYLSEYIQALIQGRISKLNTSAGAFPIFSKGLPFPENVSYSLDKIVNDTKTIDPENVPSTLKKNLMSIEEISAAIKSAKRAVQQQQQQERKI